MLVVERERGPSVWLACLHHEPFGSKLQAKLLIVVRDVSISSRHKDWLPLPAFPRCILCTTHPLHLDGDTYRADGRVIQIGTHIFVALSLFELQNATLGTSQLPGT